MSFSINDFNQSVLNVRKLMPPSPLVKSQWLSEITGANVYLKLECLNPGHSFKIRGALNALLSEPTIPDFVVTASGGNHGLGVAIAANSQNVKCKVFLPTSTSEYRIELLKKHGADVTLTGDSWDDANQVALEFANENSALYIHPFADHHVILGQGTIVHELIDQLGEFDTIIASVGGGGLISGITRSLEAHGLLEDVTVHSVETEGADCLSKSIKANELVMLQSIQSIAKTLGAKSTTPEIFNYLRDKLTSSHIVSDRDAVKGMVELLEHEKILVEPATSCIISPLLKKKIKGRTIVLIICGSNVSFHELINWCKDFDVSLPK